MLRTSRRDRRRGNILIVTLSLLALMAIVGLTAVYYTKDQAERARIQGQPKGGGEGFSADGTAPATQFLRTLLYDEQDYGTGLLNSARGHSLVATMYGRVSTQNPLPVIAWNGPGTFGGSTITAFNGVDRRMAVNHQLFPGLGTIIDPEYDTARAPSATGPVANSGTYYGKNPPYTYPDVKDFYLGSLCPATGEVLLPSFYRPQVFRDGTMPTTATGLEPSNTNWTSATGKFLTLRPRPFDHGNNFPPVPANPDGTYTGDVQNLPGGFAPNGVAHNDSIWIDTGASPITLPNGKKIKPLVAALVLDRNGLLNLSIHGNVMNGGATHASGSGLGPWEVNLGAALNPTDAATIVKARGLAQRRDAGATSTMKAFASQRYPNLTELPLGSQVPWQGFTGATPLQLPGSGSAPLFATAPTYTNGYTNINDRASASLIKNHPSLWNPTEWPTTGPAPQAFPLTDSKIFSLRYAPYPYELSQLSAGVSVPSLLGNRTTYPVPNPNPPSQSVPNSYRTDPAHAVRQLFTTYGFTHDRTGLMGGLVNGTLAPTDAAAALGAVDLNRQLADYRATTTTPLTPGNCGNQANADQDRQRFAMDIFARLIVATGVPPTVATVNATGAVVFVNSPPSASDVTMLRPLAQMAANIVDYIDSDDVSTRFTWNAGGSTPSDQVVYGVEKPRLVINEAYAEVSNDPTDPALTDSMKKKTAALDAHVRFWVELQNPTMTPYANTGANPLGDGSAKVLYSAADLGMAGAVTPYQMLIIRNNKTGTPVINGLRVQSDANYPSNVTGDPPGGTAPTFNADIVFDFSGGSAGTANATIPPANGTAGAGILMCAANVPMAPAPAVTGWSDYTPSFTGANVINAATVPTTIGGSTTALAYPITLPMTPDTDVPNTLGRHVILLRRLANPYLPYNATTNPYLTVDVMDHVRAADRVLLANGKDLNSLRTARMAVGGSGYEPSATGQEAFWPQSVGKVQPYAGYSDPTQATSTTATAISQYPNGTMVVQQNPSTTSGGVKQTFLRQNSMSATAPPSATFPPTDTMVAPFDWLVHLDRPLINQSELLHATTGRTHDLTTQFVIGTKKYGTSLQTAAYPNPAPATVQAGLTSTPPAYAQLYRALDVLTVQPYGQQTALGGRVPGRININTIQDVRVWNALFDAQTPTSFNTFDQPFVTSLWTTMITTGTNSRTPTTVTKTDATGGTYQCPVPGATGSVYDGTTGTDRPYLPFGASTVAAGSGATLAGGTSIADTLLRGTSTTPPVPYLTVTSGTHPYQQAEALRKILNNTTTVSDVFAVWITVGYFEVTSETPLGVGSLTFANLGKEYYLNAPGDTRKKFFAIVDRSNIGLDVASFNAGTPAHATVRPFFTTVEANAAQGTNTIQVSTAGSGTVVADGTTITIAASTPLVIGVGANREVVTGTPGAFADGITTITLATPLTKNHYAGECVSNVVPGNPGPQSSFDPTSDMYKPVVPVWVKLP